MKSQGPAGGVPTPTASGHSWLDRTALRQGPPLRLESSPPCRPAALAGPTRPPPQAESSLQADHR